VAVAIPSEDLADEKIEAWYAEEVFELTKKKEEHKVLPKSLLRETPSDISEKKSAFLQEYGDDAKLRITITGTPTSDPTAIHQTYNAKYFQFNIVNYVQRSTKARMNRMQRKGEPGNKNLEGYGICLINSDDSKQVQIVFDLVLISEELVSDDENASGFQKDKHLTPLEESLEQSITAANTVLREMTYMEKREQRMRKTAESINARVRWFSYLSVSVLLAVTYIQVTYLKRYFHKKKLM